MKKYGLTKTDLLVAREKIKHQRDYLEHNELITSNGQIKKLIDLSFSANHSVRYYAQLANKINTMEDIALNDNLSANFLTMTLDGFYRDLLQGNYNRYNGFSDEKKEEIEYSIPENSKLGFLRTKIKNNQKFDIKDLYNILNYQMRQFRNGKAFKKLKKENKKYIYVRTVEPHKDGVPHFHIMLFIPKNYTHLFMEDFKRFFVAPQNSISLKDKNNKSIKGTLQGFQTEINSASAYIMKYITKSFLDVKNNKELDYLNAWFVKHRIMRCVTSRSVLPQWIYNKIAILDKDWYYLTDILKSNNMDFHSEWSYKNNYFYIYDNWSDREYEYISGRLSIYSNGTLRKRVGKVIEKPYNMKSYEKVPNNWQHKNKIEKIPIFENGKITHYFINEKIIANKKHITAMKDFELLEYYNNYDVENKNYIHYLATQNLLISRGLLSGQIYNLNNFSIKEFFSLI